MGKTIGLAELTSITYGISQIRTPDAESGSGKLLRSAPGVSGKVSDPDRRRYRRGEGGDGGGSGRSQESICAIPPRPGHRMQQVLEAASLPGKRWKRVRQSGYLGALEDGIGGSTPGGHGGGEAAVRLCRVRLGQGIGGKGVVILSGDVGAVKAAVNAVVKGCDALNLHLQEHYVIPNPDPELLDFL